VQDERDLRETLRRIDGRGYKAYRDLAGSYALGDLTLHVDHVQGDPFASPSRLRVRVDQADARWEPALFANPVRRIALEDLLARRFDRQLPGSRGGRGSGKSGIISIDAGGQEVLERSAAVVSDGFVELRMRAGLPAAGRRILGREAEELLCETIPELASRALCADDEAGVEAARFIRVVENQQAARANLADLGLVAFVADGALLPRESGASDRPLREAAVAFQAPEALRVEIPVPHAESPALGADGNAHMIGLGVPEGVTLIVGGGYHGKSTLLHALERAVYPHIPDDGREGVVTRHDAVKIRAEDGRRVERCDISGFIDELPYERSTTAFRSEDASGSTSQAANIVEALEAGARVLLLDEDTSATNFMVRDARMQALVASEHEPIRPFVDRVRSLYEDHGVSTVLVMGGCGDYFDVADTVLEMRAYVPRDATCDARRVAAAIPTRRSAERTSVLELGAPRVPEAASLDASRGRRDVKLDARGTEELGFGRSRIDLRAVEQLVDASQTRGIGGALVHARDAFMDGRALPEILDALDELLDAEGPDALDPLRRGERHPGELARPRRFEVAAALGRLRTLRVRDAS